MDQRKERSQQGHKSCSLFTKYVDILILALTLVFREWGTNVVIKKEK